MGNSVHTIHTPKGSMSATGIRRANRDFFPLSLTQPQKHSVPHYVFPFHSSLQKNSFPFHSSRSPGSSAPPNAPRSPRCHMQPPTRSRPLSLQLMHPVDVTTPVENRMGLGILEFRFQKGEKATPPSWQHPPALFCRCENAPTLMAAPLMAALLPPYFAGYPPAA